MDFGNNITVNSDNDVAITGNFRSAANFGDGIMKNSVGGKDIFVAKYSGLDGWPLWSSVAGSTSDDVGNGITVDGSGNVVVTGFFFNQANFDGVLWPSAGGSDIFLIGLAP
jgi:hypothetical protein